MLRLLAVLGIYLFPKFNFTFQEMEDEIRRLRPQPVIDLSHMAHSAPESIVTGLDIEAPSASGETR
jgi:hypothetical protein